MFRAWRGAGGIAEARPLVIDAAIFGDKLHVLVRDGDDASGLKAFLAGQGIESGSPRGIVPSLEDVFVQLVTRPRAVA